MWRDPLDELIADLEKVVAAPKVPPLMPFEEVIRMTDRIWREMDRRRVRRPGTTATEGTGGA
jgi:hypothetical protein